MSGLWEHQRKEVEEHWSDPARALWFEPRTGKTRTTVEQVRRLIDERGVNRILVVGPIMALRMSWVQELKALGATTHDLTQGKLIERATKLRVAPLRRWRLLHVWQNDAKSRQGNLR